MNLDSRDKKILSALILYGPLTNNALRRATVLAKATYQRHRDYLNAEGLIVRRDIPPRKKDAIRSYYSREYSITEKGRSLLIESKLQDYQDLTEFLEHPEVRGFIEDHLLDSWIDEMITERAAEEAKYDDHLN